MTPEVIDASIAAKWCLTDESSPASDAALRRVALSGARVPAIFLFEIENLLLVAERRRRIDRVGVARAIAVLRTLPIGIEPCSLADSGRYVERSRRRELTAYDCAYLDLAVRLGTTLCTADDRLARAARAEDVAVSFIE